MDTSGHAGQARGTTDHGATTTRTGAGGFEKGGRTTTRKPQQNIADKVFGLLHFRTTNVAVGFYTKLCSL